MGKKAKKKARTPSKEKRIPTRIQKDSPRETIDPSNNTVNDGVSVTIEKRPCLHLDKGLNLTALSEKLRSSETIRCEDCREGGIDRRGNKGKGKHGKKKTSALADLNLESRAVWICLECGHYGCGGVGFPTIPQSHAVRHARLTRHQLAIQLENPNLRWCFPCSGLVSVEKMEECGESKDLFGEVIKLIKGRSAKSSKTDAEDIGFGDGSVTGEVILKADGVASGSQDRTRCGGYVVRGLVNLGNTCFFNSVMQNLLAMDRLTDHFLTSDSSSVGPLTLSLKKLFSEIKGEEGTSNVINPRSLFGSICSKAPQFRGYQQHDCHELLRCLLDLLSTEESDMRKGENSCGNNKGVTFVDSVFGGQISSSVCCMECGFSSTVYEPFLDLSLPVPTKKPTPKKSLPASRGKKAKLMPRRASRSQAKVCRDVSLSTSTDNSQPHSECLEASVSSSLGDSQVRDFTVTNDERDMRDDENGGSASHVEASAEKAAAATEDSFAWLDYLDSSEPLSAESNLVSLDNSSVLNERDGLGNDSTRMDYLCPETVADEMVPTTVKNNDVRSSNHCTVDDYLNEKQHSKSSWEDEEPLLTVQDSEVLLLPYREEDTQASLVTSGEGQMETSLVSPGVGQDESTEFDGFGDLFAEPEITLRDTGDSSLGVQKSFLSGNCSDSDPGEVDDSDFPVSVESCLAHFTKPELLSKDNAWHCEKCSKALQLHQMNKSKKKKATEKIRNNGTEDKSRTNQVILNNVSCNGNTNNDLACSGKLEHSGNNSMKSDDSKRSKGELEDETTKPDLQVSLSDQTGETHLNKGQDDDHLENESEVVEEGEDPPKTVPTVKVKRDATKRVLICKAPPILTVHLKRFCQDARGRLSKLSGHVVFQENIDLKPYIDYSRGKSEEKCLYRLQGVVEHLGTMRGGHYVAYVRGSGSVWYHVSDVRVREVLLEEVLRCDAYILFYELI